VSLKILPGSRLLREECWTSENKTQTQVVGGKEDLLCQLASILDLSKNGTRPAAQGCRVFMPQNAEASKQEGQKQMWQLASL
jgi:hypothetical protein